MKIGTIVEGPTDRQLLKAIINKLCPGEHDFRDLQPADMGESFGETGTGWKGVRRFCRDDVGKSWGSIFEFIDLFQFDLLVIHIDADVANEADLQGGIVKPIADVLQQCPPIAPTIEKLKPLVFPKFGQYQARKAGFYACESLIASYPTGKWAVTEAFLKSWSERRKPTFFKYFNKRP